jgi:hypothetical protein
MKIDLALLTRGIQNITYEDNCKKEAEHRSCVNFTFNFRGPYMKCLGTIFISFLLLSTARLDIRRDLLICVNRFRMKIDLALLTRGNQNLTYEDNCLIFKETYKFIGLDTIFDLNNSLFKKEAEHRSCVNITFKFRGPYMKCLGTIFISFLLLSNARLNFNGVSKYNNLPIT